MLKLYYHPLSTFTRRVLITLIEKAIPHELIRSTWPLGSNNPTIAR